MIFASAELAQTRDLAALIPNCKHRYILGDATSAFAGVYEDFEQAISAQPKSPIQDERAGDTMLYSSGTTGKPKGIKRPLSGAHVSEGLPGIEVNNPYGMNADTVYLSPAPLYHAAPFGFCTRALALGGTVVMMKSFDPQLALGYIEQYSITHSQWVPTHFVRLLRLPEEEAFDRAFSSWVSGPPTVTQAIVADFMDEGHFATHIRMMRRMYKARYETLMDVSRQVQGAIDVQETAGGFHTAAYLADGLEEGAIVAQAAERAKAAERAMEEAQAAGAGGDEMPRTGPQQTHGRGL